MTNSQRYVQFTPHENNTNEAFDAQDINELQDGIEQLQSQSFTQADGLFLQRALFELEHHMYATAFIYDQFTTRDKMDLGASEGVTYLEDVTSIAFDDANLTQGTFQTQLIANPTGKPMRHVTLLTDEYKPTGTNIAYEFSYDGEQFYPIVANVPTSLVPAQPTDRFMVRAIFTRNTTDLQPRLDSWALLYDDETYRFKFLDDGMDVNTDAEWDGTIIP